MEIKSYSIKLLFKIGTIVFGTLIEHATPALREELKKVLFDLNDKAEKTDNPFDDLLTIFLIKLLGFDEDFIQEK